MPWTLADWCQGSTCKTRGSARKLGRLKGRNLSCGTRSDVPKALRGHFRMLCTEALLRTAPTRRLGGRSRKSEANEDNNIACADQTTSSSTGNQLFLIPGRTSGIFARVQLRSNLTLAKITVSFSFPELNISPVE